MSCNYEWCGGTFGSDAACPVSGLVLQGMTPDQFRSLMAVDKKVLDGNLRLILLKGPLGNCVFTNDFDPAALDASLEAFCQ